MPLLAKKVYMYKCNILIIMEGILSKHNIFAYYEKTVVWDKKHSSTGNI